MQRGAPQTPPMQAPLQQDAPAPEHEAPSARQPIEQWPNMSQANISQQSLSPLHACEKPWQAQKPPLHEPEQQALFVVQPSPPLVHAGPPPPLPAAPPPPSVAPLFLPLPQPASASTNRHTAAANATVRTLPPIVTLYHAANCRMRAATYAGCRAVAQPIFRAVRRSSGAGEGACGR